MRRASGKHTVKDVKPDTLKLSQQFIDRRLFKEVPYRAFTAFPQFPANVFDTNHAPEMKKWMKTNLDDFRTMNVYQRVNDK